jgi:glycosyltransferase involved in cell wall biosynthesis
MKILHINTERTWRGGEQQALYLLAGLKKQGITSHLVCQNESPMHQKAMASGIQVTPIAMHGEVDLLAIRRLRALVKENRYSIIHSHTSHAHALAYWSSIGTRVRRLVTRRVDFSIYRHSFLGLSGLKYRYMADFYIAISHKIKEIMVADGIMADHIFVVHSGIDPNRFAGHKGDYLRSEFDLEDDEHIIINVAHLAGHKGQKYLVHAIPLVLSKFSKLRFIIIGGGKLLEELKALASSLGLKQELIFTGFRSDVGAFYHLADLFVMSSVQEGLGTAVLDALALGKPVVATLAGGIPEIITDGQTGRLVPTADPEALAEGIVYMMTQRDEAMRMAQQGRDMVRRNFSIKSMIENNIRVYQHIMAH